MSMPPPARRFARALVVGKFAPLHLGHERVVATAEAAADAVLVLSYANPERPGCEAARRAAWLAARFPRTRRVVLTDTWLAAHAPASARVLPRDDAPDDVHRHFVATLLAGPLAFPVDAVFSSEGYGPGFAGVLAARVGRPVAHVAVDPERRDVPISGTALRADVHAGRRFLAPEVYASFVRRVALVGGESSGKSTLAAALAARFGTTCVAEYGRERWEAQAGRLAAADLVAIAEEQVRREEAALVDPATCRFVFCDTTPLTTRFYAEELFGAVPARVAELAEGRAYDITLLCAPDFAFVQDGTRQDATFRARGDAFYRRELARAGVGFVEVAGSLAARVERVAQLVT
jgi:NadR type nicotinamide-nucleotide adenylyltransferase